MEPERILVHLSQWPQEPVLLRPTAWGALIGYANIHIRSNSIFGFADNIFPD